MTDHKNDEHRRAQYRSATKKRRDAREAAGLPRRTPGPGGPDKTAAERQKRYRERKKAEKAKLPVDTL